MVLKLLLVALLVVVVGLLLLMMMRLMMLRLVTLVVFVSNGLGGALRQNPMSLGDIVGR
jgi:hypothetical protein